MTGVQQSRQRRRRTGRGQAAFTAQAQHGFDRIIRAGSTRAGDESALLHLLPFDPTMTLPLGRTQVISRLRRALRCERRLGRMGHWSYNLRRHVALAQALTKLLGDANDGPG